MPRGDRTGPAGMGPMTGRAAGYCAGYNVPGYMNPVGRRFGMGFGPGFGRGRGRGMGAGRWWGAWGYSAAPPYGFALFYARAIVPKEIPMSEIYKAVIPFIFLQLICLVIVMAFPSLSTWLPSVLITK